MNPVARSLLFALANLLHPRMLWLMLWPVLAALALWGTLTLVFWAQLAGWLASLINQWLTTGMFAIQWDVKDAALVGAKVLIVILLVPLIQLTALLILSTFGMPAMVEHVAARGYAQLERRKGGNLVVAAFDQRTRGLLQTGGRTPRRLSNEDGDDREQNEERRHAEGMDPARRPKAKPPHRCKASGNVQHVPLII